MKTRLVTPDRQGRLQLRKVADGPRWRYLAYTSPDGIIILVPADPLPAHGTQPILNRELADRIAAALQ